MGDPMHSFPYRVDGKPIFQIGIEPANFASSYVTTGLSDFEMKMPLIWIIVKSCTNLDEGAWVSDRGNLLVCYTGLWQINRMRRWLEETLQLKRADIIYVKVDATAWTTFA